MLEILISLKKLFSHGHLFLELYTIYCGSSGTAPIHQYAGFHYCSFSNLVKVPVPQWEIVAVYYSISVIIRDVLHILPLEACKQALPQCWALP
ncbi:hypothetical protein HMI56_003020 [Coelomomyces lativittatus]|nr:hypothetical protein HMI56_003020 [Coelomomyces lativittatus]